MIRFHPAIAVTASALVIAVIGCTTPQGERPPSAKTPIEHVIVVVGENISFDNLYGTYEPAPGQSVATVRDGSSAGSLAAPVQSGTDQLDEPRDRHEATALARRDYGCR